MADSMRLYGQRIWITTGSNKFIESSRTIYLSYRINRHPNLTMRVSLVWGSVRTGVRDYVYILSSSVILSSTVRCAWSPRSYPGSYINKLVSGRELLNVVVFWNLNRVTPISMVTNGGNLATMRMILSGGGNVDMHRTSSSLVLCYSTIW
jgi:hypothetical protein